MRLSSEADVEVLVRDGRDDEFGTLALHKGMSENCRMVLGPVNLQGNANTRPLLELY